MTLYHLPMLPVKNRYPQEWWFQFRKAYENVSIDFEFVIPNSGWEIPFEFDRTEGTFSPVRHAALWELEQLHVFVRDFLPKLKDDDKVFFTDIDFPGFATSLAQLIRQQNSSVGLFGYLHAGSYCKRDIFSTVSGKLQSEVGMLHTFDGIFVGSQYHQDKVFSSLGGEGFENVYVIPPPFYREQVKGIKVKRYDKRKYDVVYTSRIDRQKTLDTLLWCIENNTDMEFLLTNQISCVRDDQNDFDKMKNVHHRPTADRKSYYEAIADSTLLLSTAEEETFGYCAVEAMALGTIPVLPNQLAYPEVVREVGGRTFLYNDEGELKDMIRKAVVYAALKSEPVEYDIDIYEESIDRMLQIMGEK